MAFGPEQLYFGTEYAFEVTVEYEGETYAGKLSLTKDAVHLFVSAEIAEGKQDFLPWDHIAQIDCHAFNATITLVDLRFMSGSSRSIGYSPRKGFCERKYEVGFVIYSQTQFDYHRSFCGISIHSDTISKWIGNTEKQEDIIKLYESGDLFRHHNHFLEFSWSIPSIGLIEVAYNTTMFHSSPEFRAGITFPPSLCLYFARDLSVEKSLGMAADLITFFKFITGGNVELNKIELLSRGETFTKSATLFFPRADSYRREDEYIFFPLGKDLRFDQLGLPELPSDILANFFLQNARQSNFFKKYLKYKDMKSNEEKFLGLFRLLEALAYKEGKYLDEDTLVELANRSKPYLVKKFGDQKSVIDFLKRIPKWNLSKYNTEKCIIDLLRMVPNSVSDKWKYDAKDIAAICKLRNDITHANEYEASTTTVSGYTKFIEALVVYSLLIKIGIDSNSSSAILSRLSGYYELAKFDGITTRATP